MAEKIAMKTPLVEMNGDEMTRVIWEKIKEILIEPHVDYRAEYYDLGLAHREATDDKVTVDAANAVKRLGVGVKCATITPNEERVAEYGLTRMYKSPNGTLRAILDGTVFRAPILARGITPYIPSWKKPITIARHAYGDVYKNTEMLVGGDAGARLELVSTGKDGTETRALIYDFGGGGHSSGVTQGIHNTDESIESFARACMNYALDVKQDLWFAAKDTISKIYDRRFRDIFEEQFEKFYRPRFQEAGITYCYTLIDDAIARAIRSEGGFVWACKNYDGDVLSDMVATAYGSLAMMQSVLVSPDGCFEYEAAHGTVQRHYYKHLKGEATSTNPIATIYAWSGALRKRAELDELPELAAFGENLERAAIETIENGILTGDLYDIYSGNKRRVGTEEFLSEVAGRLGKR